MSFPAKRHNSMRGEFGAELYEHMKKNKKIFLLVGDLGYGLFDYHFRDFKNRTYNCGAAEQGMMDIAIGLALEGKIPVVYSITTFLLYRPFESLRTYINHEKIPVKLVGSGRDTDYLHDGISHDSTDAKIILKTLPNIHTVWPDAKEEIPNIVDYILKCPEPDFVSLRR